jgi:hypothetical protein
MQRLRYPEHRVLHRIRQNHKRDIIISQREPSEYEVENLVRELDVDPGLADERVGRAVEVVEVHKRVHGGEEGAVEPSTTLRDQLGDLIRDVGDGVGGLDVVQQPGAVALRDEFPAEDLYVRSVDGAFEP